MEWNIATNKWIFDDSKNGIITFVEDISF